MNFGMDHAPGAGWIAGPVDLQICATKTVPSNSIINNGSELHYQDILDISISQDTLIFSLHLTHILINSITLLPVLATVWSQHPKPKLTPFILHLTILKSLFPWKEQLACDFSAIYPSNMAPLYVIFMLFILVPINHMSLSFIPCEALEVDTGKVYIPPLQLVGFLWMKVN